MERWTQTGTTGDALARDRTNEVLRWIAVALSAGAIISGLAAPFVARSRMLRGVYGVLDSGRAVRPGTPLLNLAFTLFLLALLTAVASFAIAGVARWARQLGSPGRREIDADVQVAAPVWKPPSLLARLLPAGLLTAFLTLVAVGFWTLGGPSITALDPPSPNGCTVGTRLGNERIQAPGGQGIGYQEGLILSTSPGSREFIDTGATYSVAGDDPIGYGAYTLVWEPVSGGAQYQGTLTIGQQEPIRVLCPSG